MNGCLKINKKEAPITAITGGQRHQGSRGASSHSILSPALAIESIYIQSLKMADSDLQIKTRLFLAKAYSVLPG